MPNESDDKKSASPKPFTFNVRAYVYLAVLAAGLSVTHKVASLFLFGAFRWDIWWTLPVDLWVLASAGTTAWRYRYVHYTCDNQEPLCQDRYDRITFLGLRHFILRVRHKLTDYPSQVTCPVCKKHPKLPETAPTRFGMI